MHKKAKPCPLCSDTNRVETDHILPGVSAFAVFEPSEAFQGAVSVASDIPSATSYLSARSISTVRSRFCLLGAYLY